MTHRGSFQPLLFCDSVKKEEVASATPRDTRAVGEGRESHGMGSREQTLAEGERLGQASLCQRPPISHHHVTRACVLCSALRP